MMFKSDGPNKLELIHECVRVLKGLWTVFGIGRALKAVPHPYERVITEKGKSVCVCVCVHTRRGSTPQSSLTPPLQQYHSSLCPR